MAVAGTLSVMELVSIHEIAAALGVSRQRADQLSRQRDFPKPLGEVRAGRIWRKRDFEKWMEAKGR